MTELTVPFNDRLSGPYAATLGQTVFSYDFPIDNDTDLVVVRQRAGGEAVLTLTVDYTVTGVGNQAGGTIVLTSGAQAGDIIVITGAEPYQRNTNFQPPPNSPSAVDFNAQLNSIQMQVQQLRTRADLSLRLRSTDPVGDMHLPLQAARADKLLGFDGSGLPVALPQNVGGVQQLNGLLTIDISAGAGLSDQSVWDATAALRLSSTLPAAGGAGAGSANQFGHSIQVLVPVTNSQASYEKCAAIFIAATSDPSQYGPDILRDVVGLDMRGYIRNDNALGRAWGGYSEARILAGGVGDGALIGHECQVLNEGTEQLNLGTSTSKYGQILVSAGSVAATAAVYITRAGSSTWRKGFVVDVAALFQSSDPAFQLSDGNAVIDRAGNATFAAGLRIGFAGTPTIADRIEIGDSAFYLDNQSGAPLIVFDANDQLAYDRSIDAWVYYIGATARAVLSAAAFRPATNDGLAIGSTAESFSDLFLASGAVINIANGNWVATHTSGILTIGAGDVRVTNAGTNAASVVTLDGSQTLANKTLTAPTANEYRVSGTKVVGAQGAAVADASGGTTVDAEARTAINAWLARARTHGLIAT